MRMSGAHAARFQPFADEALAFAADMARNPRPNSLARYRPCARLPRRKVEHREARRLVGGPAEHVAAQDQRDAGDRRDARSCEFLLHREQRHRGLGGAGAFVELGRIGADHRLRFVLDGEHAVADRDPVHRQRHDPARAFAGHDFKMIGLASDNHAERDEALVLAALGRRGDRARAARARRGR